MTETQAQMMEGRVGRRHIVNLLYKYAHVPLAAQKTL